MCQLSEYLDSAVMAERYAGIPCSIQNLKEITVDFNVDDFSNSKNKGIKLKIQYFYQLICILHKFYAEPGLAFYTGNGLGTASGVLRKPVI